MQPSMPLALMTSFANASLKAALPSDIGLVRGTAWPNEVVDDHVRRCEKSLLAMLAWFWDQAVRLQWEGCLEGRTRKGGH